MQTTTISVSTETYNRLKNRAHLGQTLDGIISELLNEIDLYDQAKIDMKGFTPEQFEEIRKDIQQHSI